MGSKTIQNLFIDLHFSPGTIFRFRNNYGQEYEDALVLFDFIRRLKEKHGHVKFTNIPFKNSYEGSLGIKRRCLSRFRAKYENY